MNVDSYRQSLDETLNAFAFQFQKFFEIFYKTLQKVQKELIANTSNWQSPVEFTNLQWTLLKVLLVLLILTLTLIIYSWKAYGNVINEKFVQPSTLKEIEELKLSVAKLKLPKEHSPRI